ncbi:Ankyrin repeat-containing domain protein [Apiospora arundinis]|uniref:Ankyrin repeat-containing domain protein n=1 Tax=Apiospora arundinis TaxID=335852 RepID=A0ABR2JI88_9PEZI
MDPLSLAASVAGLTSLGIQITGGISIYLDALKCRDEELEAIRRQNGVLRSIIASIETTSFAIQSLPLSAAAAAAQSIKLCTEDLDELEMFVAQLSGSDLSTWRLRLKDKSRRLHYAFDRPKISQLHTRIGQSKATLQLVVAELELLSLVDSSLRDNATDLLLVRSEVAATHGPVMEIRERLPGLQAKIAGLQPQLESHYGMVAERISESTAATSQQIGHVQNTIEASFGLQQSLLQRFDGIQSTLEMLCAGDGRVQSISGDAHSLTKAAAYLVAKPAELEELGSIFMYYQQTKESHSPNCPMARIIPSQQQRRYGLRLVGLTRIVKAAIDISFAMSFGAGGRSISPQFAYYPTVDSDMDPAFRVVGYLREVLSQYPHMTAAPPFYAALEHKALLKILQLFSEGKSSPFAVDSKNRTLMHHVLGAVDSYPLRNPYVPPPTRRFILDLLSAGVPAMSYDIYGNCPAPTKSDMSISFMRNQSIETLRILMEAEGVVMPITTSGNFSLLLRGKYYLGSTTELTEASGSGPLIMAVKTNNRERVLSLLAEYPDSVKQRNHCGDNALVVAAYGNSLRFFPELLEAAKAVISSDENAIDMDRVLEIAITSTRAHCISDEKAIECTRCSCSDSLALLLENSAELFTSDNSISVFDWLKRSPQRCRRLCIRHLSFQRENLKRICLSNQWALRSVQHLLKNNQVLDLHARQMSTLLQEHGVHVPAHLLPETRRWSANSTPLYSLVRDINTSEQLFQSGFCDIDYDSCYGMPPLTKELNPHLILWFLEHGANPKRRIKLYGKFHGEDRWTTSAHYVMFNIGSWMHYNLALEEARASYITVIRFEAFNALGLTHTCCRNYRYLPTARWDPCPILDEEDILEIQEEESDLLATLDSIVDEFENRLKDADGGLDELQDCSTSFWRFRLPDILEDRRHSNMTEEERREAEAIGVEWEDNVHEYANPAAASAPAKPSDIPYVRGPRRAGFDREVFALHYPTLDDPIRLLARAFEPLLLQLYVAKTVPPGADIVHTGNLGQPREPEGRHAAQRDDEALLHVGDEVYQALEVSRQDGGEIGGSVAQPHEHQTDLRHHDAHGHERQGHDKDQRVLLSSSHVEVPDEVAGDENIVRVDDLPRACVLGRQSLRYALNDDLQVGIAAPDPGLDEARGNGRPPSTVHLGGCGLDCCLRDPKSYTTS